MQEKGLKSKVVAAVIITLITGIALGSTVAITWDKETSPSNDKIILSPESAEKDPEAYQPDLDHQTLLDINGKATGRVTCIEMFVEGEQERYHFLLLPDLPYREMVNDANIQHLNGALMVEILVKDQGILPKLYIGQHLEIEGPHVIDNDHGWNEIDPVRAIKEI